MIYLLDMVTQKDADFNNLYDTVSELQGYAIEIRYPDETIFLSNDIVEKAMTIAKNVRELVIGKINISIDYNKIIDR